MPKKTKLGKSRLDKFYHLAKEQGYRSRAAFKLVQLNKKYEFLGKSKVVLDLCAAPGSWAQVAVKHMPVSSIIIAIDLVPIKPIKNVICLQEDITTDKCKAAIKNHLKTWKVDTVLNDGAPNVGANWSKDAYTQSELSLYALKLATSFLASGGTFVTKVFRSQDYNALLWVFNQLFKRVESTKPQASRNESAEIFVVCLGYLAPKKIDPKLLDPKHVFAELDLNPAKRPNVLQAKKEGRHRDGYEPGVTMLYKEMSASDFVQHEDALQVLTDFNKLVFGKNGQDQQLAENPSTTSEIIECCKDLRVLGKREFRNLLRWRDSMRKLLGCVSRENEDKKDDEKEGSESADEDEDEETKLLKEVDGLRKKAVSREKRKRRKEREKKAKYQRRIDLKMENPDDVLTVPEEMGLFSLRQIENSAGLEALQDGTKQADSYAEASSESDGDDDDIESSSDDDDAAEARRKKVEAELDLLYEDYCVRTGQKTKKIKQGKKEKGLSELEARSNEFSGFISEPGFVPDMTRDVVDEVNDSNDENDANPLLDDLGSKESQRKENAEADEHAALLWFQNPIFNEVKWDAPTSAPCATETETKPTNLKKRTTRDEQESDAVTGDCKRPAVGVGREMSSSAPQDVGDDSGAFEEVAADVSDSDSSCEDESEGDGEAEVAALGAMLLKKKIRKEDLIDACYHRYAFNDADQAPRWFKDAERKFNRRQLPVTKAMVEEQKRQYMEIAARPIKKVAEAKARKKLKAVRAQQKLNNKADSLSNDTDMDDKSKMRALQKLYAKGVAVKRPKSVTVIAKKGKGQARGKKGTKIVDRRMKKDMASTVRTGNRNFKGGKKARKQNSQHGAHGTKSKGGERRKDKK